MSKGRVLKTWEVGEDTAGIRVQVTRLTGYRGRVWIEAEAGELSVLLWIFPQNQTIQIELPVVLYPKFRLMCGSARGKKFVEAKSVEAKMMRFPEVEKLQEEVRTLKARVAEMEEKANPMAVCSHCGKRGIPKRLMGARCHACGKRPGDPRCDKEAAGRELREALDRLARDPSP